MSEAKVATKSDWDIQDMPQQCETFILNRAFSDTQMTRLRQGNIPQEMEDKWFWYMENDTLYAHRSWTGFCLYIVQFASDNNHIVTVNRDSSQYTCTSVEQDLQRLNELLDWWTQPNYDYYGEWLSETASALSTHRATTNTHDSQ